MSHGRRGGTVLKGGAGWRKAGELARLLAHKLDLVLPTLPFAGINVDSELSAKGARELLPQVLVKGERYKRVREKRSQG